MAESNGILVAGSSGMEAKGRIWNIGTGKESASLCSSIDMIH